MRRSQRSNPPKKDVKAAIFDAACTVIRDKGFHQARVTDIANHAGISYGLVYHYFNSKEDLFEAIFHKWWDGLFAVLERSDKQQASVKERLEAIIDYFLDMYEKRPDLAHIFITEISRSTANLTPARLKYFRIFFGKTEKLITRAQEEGLLRRDVRALYLSFIFLGSIESFVSLMVLGEQPIKSPDQKNLIAKALWEVFYNGAKAA